MNSVPVKPGSAGSVISAWSVLMSVEAVLGLFPGGDIAVAAPDENETRCRSNVARASFSPTPNLPTTLSGWFSFSLFSFWVRCS